MNLLKLKNLNINDLRISNIKFNKLIDKYYKCPKNKVIDVTYMNNKYNNIKLISRENIFCFDNLNIISKNIDNFYKAIIIIFGNEGLEKYYYEIMLLKEHLNKNNIESNIDIIGGNDFISFNN